ncbi:MAG: hypothetical protein IT431_09630 [Phycisphaerales bacterium]|nr:hypothetical protein [Phycisphaerales bacterium]
MAEPDQPTRPDELSMHELLDRSYLSMEIFGQHVLEHHALETLPKLKAQAEAVHQALFDFYQAVGAVDG